LYETIQYLQQIPTLQKKAQSYLEVQLNLQPQSNDIFYLKWINLAYRYHLRKVQVQFNGLVFQNPNHNCCNNRHIKNYERGENKVENPVLHHGFVDQRGNVNE